MFRLGRKEPSCPSAPARSTGSRARRGQTDALPAFPHCPKGSRPAAGVAGRWARRDAKRQPRPAPANPSRGWFGISSKWQNGAGGQGPLTEEVSDRSPRHAQSGRCNLKHITYSWPITSIPLGKGLQPGILLSLLSHMMGRIRLKSSPPRTCSPSHSSLR